VSSAAEPVRFDRWLDNALYGPHGFYTAGGGRAGRREGSFLTSPEVGPLFGTVLARLIEAEDERLGRPPEFTVYDVGAGPGTLARAVLAARPATRYVCVEVSEAQRALHPDGVASIARLPEGPLVGVVLANELLDNLAFRLAVWDSGWREAWVAEADGKAVEVLAPFADGLPECLPRRGVPHGARAPVQQAAAGWVHDTLDRLTAGRLLVIDYCSPTTAGIASRPWREWLRTYRDQARGGHYLTAAGEQDVTCEVAVDQLIAATRDPDAVRTQAQFLAYWGIEDLVDEGRQAWESGAHAPGLEAIRGRSRLLEAQALTDPAGLGAFTVLEWVA
jgi:SAM-dependent MidA family methyltransferase